MRPVVLSPAELDLLGDLLGVAPPAVLGGAGGAPDPAVRAGLTARGLLDGPVPARWVAAAVRRLAGAPLRLELHRRRPDRLDAVAAVGAGDAVLAVRRRDEVTVRRMNPDRASGSVLDLLAPLRPAAGRAARVPVTVLTDAVAAAGDDPRRLVVELMRRGTAGPCARAVVAASRDVDALARIGVTLRDTRGPYLITVQHNAYGHHCLRPGPGGDLLTAPATPDRLTHELDELIHAAAGRPGQRRGAGRGSTRPAETGGIGSGTATGTW